MQKKKRNKFVSVLLCGTMLLGMLTFGLKIGLSAKAATYSPVNATWYGDSDSNPAKTAFTGQNHGQQKYIVLTFYVPSFGGHALAGSSLSIYCCGGQGGSPAVYIPTGGNVCWSGGTVPSAGTYLSDLPYECGGSTYVSGSALTDYISQNQGRYVSFVIYVSGMSDGGGDVYDLTTAYLSFGVGNSAPTVSGSNSITMNENGGTQSTYIYASDPENDALSFSIYSQPSRGSAYMSGYYACYTPGANQYGPDSFTVQVSDGNGGYAYQTVNVTINQSIPPTVSTVQATAANVTNTTANISGNVTDQGTNTATRGVCYSSSTSNPTVSNSCTYAGTGAGSYTANLTGLTPDTTYYYRAFAYSSAGTSYGAVYSFTTACNLQLSATPDNTGNQVGISWNAFPNWAGYAYTLSRDSNQIYSGSAASYIDTAASDRAAPAAVTNVSAVRQSATDHTRTINFTSAIDNGSSYSYTISTVDQNGEAAASTASATVTTGVAGYAVSVDQSPTGNPGGSIGTATTSYVTGALTDGQWYAHINAVDNAGNISSTVNYGFYVDNTAPAITLNPGTNGDEVTVEVHNPYHDPGASAADSHDGALSVVTDAGEVDTDVTGDYSVIYTAADLSGNKATAARTVHVVDTTKPVISLTGQPVVHVNLGCSYSDAGATAADNYDGSVTVDTDNPVNTNVSGTYTVTYRATDAHGNAAVPVTRSVVVAPVFSDISVGESDPSGPYTGGWTDGNVTFTLGSGINAEGFSTYQYSNDGMHWVAFSGNSLILSANQNQSYTFRVMGLDGSTGSDTQSFDVKIDKAIPELHITGEPAGWTNQNVLLNIAASAGISGIRSVTVGKVGDAASLTNITNDTSYIVSQNGSYLFTITSFSGLTASMTINISTIDKDAPENVRISFRTNSFTSFLNHITFGLFFRDTVDVTLSGDDHLSGIDHYEYQLVETEKGQSYDANGVWNKGAALSIPSQFKGVIYARAVDRADNISGTVSSNGLEVNNVAPAIQGVANGGNYYIGHFVSFTSAYGETASSVYTKDSSPASDFSSGTFFSAPGSYTLTVTDKMGNQNTLSFKINPLPPVSDVVYTSGYETLLKNITSELAADTMLPNSYAAGIRDSINALNARYEQLDSENAAAESAADGIKNSVNRLPDGSDGLIAMKSTLQAQLGSVSGPNSTLTPEQQAALSDVAGYLRNELAAIAALENQDGGIAAQAAGIPTDMNGLIGQQSGIQNILSSISGLTNEQQQILRPQTEKLNSLLTQIEALQNQDASVAVKAAAISTDTNGLIGQKTKIENILQNIGSLTAEQQQALKTQSGLLNSLLVKIDSLQKQNKAVMSQVSAVPTADEGLISQGDTVQGLLEQIRRLTPEQQNLLTDQKAQLQALIARIDSLKGGVTEIQNKIKALPASDKITKENMQDITDILAAFNKMTNEQKALLGSDLVSRMNEDAAALSKLLLYDGSTGTSVAGIQGTTFSPDTYLLVKPITDEKQTGILHTASAEVAQAAQLSDDIRDKELVSLYSISMLKGSTTIEPDGNVQVRIKIPASLQDRNGLDVVWIGEKGEVKSMHAKREGDYLVFITNHFSYYGIIANQLWYDQWYAKAGMIALAALLLLAGAILAAKKLKRRNREHEA